MKDTHPLLPVVRAVKHSQRIAVNNSHTLEVEYTRSDRLSHGTLVISFNRHEVGDKVETVRVPLCSVTVLQGVIDTLSAALKEYTVEQDNLKMEELL